MERWILAERVGLEPTPAVTPALFSKQVRQTNIRLLSRCPDNVQIMSRSLSRFAEDKGVEPSPVIPMATVFKTACSHEHYLPCREAHRIRTYSAFRHLFYRQAQLSHVGGTPFCRARETRTLTRYHTGF